MIFKKISNSIISLSVLSLILGIIFILYPEYSLTALGYTVAAYLIIHGITLFILDIKARKLYIPFEGMLTGVLSVILGILLAKNPVSLAVYIGVAFGLWVIISGIGGIRLATALKGTGAPWVFMLILNILDIIMGIIVLYTPVLSSVSITIYTGIIIAAHSVINLINMISVRRNISKLEKIIIER